MPGSRTRTSTIQGARSLRGHISTVTGVAFSPDGKRIARPKREKDVKANRVTFSPDSEFLLAECMGGATVWRTESWDLHFDLPCTGSWLSGVSLSSDGETFAVCGLQKGIAVHRINGDLLRTFEGYGTRHHTLAVNPTGETLAVTGSRILAVWDLVSGEERYVIPEQNENVVAFSSDGLLLATAIDRPQPVVVIRNAASGHERIRLSGHATKLNSAVFSPDSQRLVSADGDGAIMLWQLQLHGRQTEPSPP